MGCSPWACKELDGTERPPFSLSPSVSVSEARNLGAAWPGGSDSHGPHHGAEGPPSAGLPGAGGVPSQEVHSHGWETVLAGALSLPRGHVNVSLGMVVGFPQSKQSQRPRQKLQCLL